MYGKNNDFSAFMNLLSMSKTKKAILFFHLQKIHFPETSWYNMGEWEREKEKDYSGFCFHD